MTSVESEKKADDVEMVEEAKPRDPTPSAKIAKQVALIVSEADAKKSWRKSIDQLLDIEKRERQAEEEANVLHICVSVLELARKSEDWKLAIEYVEIVCRRRSQFRKVVVRTVQCAMEWIDTFPDAGSAKLIDSLIGVTEGKIFVEVERARLTRRKADMAESEGRIGDAADILQELQIETFGSMVKREKCDFLLEQVRLCLAKRDFIRAGIIRNKITSKILKDLKDLEVKYWNMSLIYFYHHERQYLELSKSYRRLKELMTAERDRTQALANSVVALVLAPHSNEQHDLLHKYLVSEAKELERLPLLRQMLRLLTTHELIAWPMPTEINQRLSEFEFDGVAAEKQSYGEEFHSRVIEHNIRVVHKYYQRIKTARLASFLGIDVDETERYLSEMVSSGDMYARVDRLEGIVVFRKKATSNEVLNEWRSDINELLRLVDQTCHQIHKETMVHTSKRKKGKKRR
jgi:26S proteasome regulatory subunit N5